MGFLVVEGAVCQCPFGTTCPLQVTSQGTITIEGKKIATIADGGLTNLKSFGMCTTQSNPAVAAATTAALGVPTPAPCVPSLTGTWVAAPGARPMVGGNVPLQKGDTCNCSYGGTINIQSEGQMKVSI